MAVEPVKSKPLPRKIQKLEEVVVNRIAAGEVIQRPANAVKEMIENCLDAGATSIQITVKQGGLKLLQIQDNGCGIKKEDMHIVCERFTTSKLRKFEDLRSINTYGFRGEALASISHVAHVTITTRTTDSKCAYKASYSDGKLVPLRPGAPAEPKPCAGNQGTLIVVEDLFFNITVRKLAMKSASEEYSRIADVITKYAVHNAGVGFTLKKYGETVADVRTPSTNSTKDNISSLYGAPVARELLDIFHENTKLGFKMQGFITNANYSVKKLQFLLFINHRLVDSQSIRKSVEAMYSVYLPKHTHPFIYLSIDIAPSNIDVNVHPTKHEVHFLHEDMIVEAIQKTMEERLLGSNTSRTFFTQSLLPGSIIPVSLPGLETGGRREREGERTAGDGARKADKQATYAYQMVRTDPRERKLDAFVRPKSSEETGPSVAVGLSGASGEDSMDTGESGGGKSRRGEAQGRVSAPGIAPQEMMGGGTPHLPFSKRPHRKEVHLTSVQQLQHSVRAKQHREMEELFRNHKFVGCVNQTRALVQHQTRLYLMDLTRVTKELFYQILLFDFANFSTLKVTPPAPIYDLAMLGLNSPESGWTAEDGPKESLAQYIVDFLKTKADMLKDYLSFEIGDDGCVHSLPVLLDSYSPNLDRLPLFLLRLATEVEWSTEKECFQTLAQECGIFYSIRHDPFLLDSQETEATASKDVPEISTQQPSQESKGESSQPDPETAGVNPSLYKKQPWRWTIEHVIFPALRTDFIPQRSMADDGSILQIADLHELYKVFERC